MKPVLISEPAVLGGARSLRRDQDEQVIRVDRLDRALGVAGKLDVHRRGLLHRAFSIFVFNPAEELLLQRRADCKYHFAGLWSNTCCGHPRPGETTADAAARRLEEELGFSTLLGEFLKLTYRARDPISELVEYEFLHVFRGDFCGEPKAHPDEVGAWEWMSIANVREALDRDRESFTPWFSLLFQQIFPADQKVVAF